MTVDLNALGAAAKTASRTLAQKTSAEKNTLLLALADAVDANVEAILAANASDLEVAKANGTSDALLDRLALSEARLVAITGDVRAVAMLPDPVGAIFNENVLPSGLKLHQRRVPLGVLGVIYEARPNVTVDIASLALKTGNAVILRGGSETLRTNGALVAALQSVLPENAVQLIASPDRALVQELLQLHEFVDMIIPRGGAGLHDFCRKNSTIPVIIGGIGVCHLFVDESADLNKAIPVIANAKCRRPSVCNSLDTLLIHEAIAAEFLPKVHAALEPLGVRFVHDEFDTEWMSLTLGIQIVSGLDQAIAHIQKHSSQHTDGILTQSDDNAAQFIAEVDSAAVFVNCSTGFNDGGQFGLGAEVAISTQKLHARGPMGLEALTTYKWVGSGDYLLRK
ncbi:glutamate-5-semialdehyde dehydrogenase [Armatimonas sp.]|uniref:glutamate-5-semialdehyde dehydrogenase n=1 Tax=Armatimonas sp. TaxID=1872638 RepID=UPI00286A6CD3|nr:glutamate-5-semialdehyde dehydrogenase [Armatimonas sp.]